MPERDFAINVSCIRCKTPYKIMVCKEDFDLWQSGIHIQDCMPYLSVDEREMLISKICSPCFDKICGEE